MENILTQQQIDMRATMHIVLALAETIREAKEIPSGELYAILCGKLSLESYNRVIQCLLNTGLVKQKNYLLTWTGPEVKN